MYGHYIAMKIYVHYIAMKISHIWAIFSHISISYVQLICHTIIIPWILHTHKLYQNLSKWKSQFLSQLYSMKLLHNTTTYFYQVKVFPKVTNTFLYINQTRNFLKSTHHTTPHGSPCDFTCIIKWLTFHMIFHMN
jgi:hypothetical protein